MKERFLHHSVAFFATFMLVGVVFFGSAVFILFRSGHIPLAQSKEAVAFPAAVLTEPVLTAQAAILYDATNGTVLYAKNASLQLPLASLTKLMTAEIVLSQKSPTTTVRITESALEPLGDWGFAVGDTVPLKELLKIGLIASSNDAMQAAAESLGPQYIKRMNSVAHELGLTQTYFLNPTGLDLNESTSGAYGSAYDVARLTALFYKQYPTVFEQTQASSVSIPVGNRVLYAHATALPLLSIPGFIGAKTGYTDLAGGNLVAVFDAEIGHPLVAVVLGSTKEGRFDDIRSLIKTIRKQ